MSNFAKEQLLKYGWTEGKGLGKNENGIITALKPKLKFDTSGIGHKEVDTNWWQKSYDSALNSLKVEKTDNKDVSFRVDSKQGLNSQKEKMKLHHGNFLKTAVLKDGAVIKESKFERPVDKLESDLKFVNISDEDLFKACGGRTAHKGARHGLNMGGKLARLEKQDSSLLKTKRKRELNSSSEEDEEDDVDKLVSAIAKKYENQVYVETTKNKKKIRRRVENLSCQLEQACVIDNSTENSSSKRNKIKRKLEPELEFEDQLLTKKEKKRLRKLKNKKDTNPLVDEDETMKNDDEIENLEAILKNNKKYQKLRSKGKDSSNTSSKSKYTFCTAEKLNSKISKKKASKLARKDKKLVDGIAKDLENSLVFNSEEESRGGKTQSLLNQYSKKKFKHSKKLKKKLKQMRQLLDEFPTQ